MREAGYSPRFGLVRKEDGEIAPASIPGSLNGHDIASNIFNQV